jgi:mediator of RNA polymerase II transcription subunit 21
MADRLTQLQDCLDQLLTQMYATIRYIDTHHAYASIPNQADQFTDPHASAAASSSDPTQSTQPTSSAAAAAAPTPAADADAAADGEHEPSSKDPAPDPPALFAARLRELAQDLVVKEQQAELLADGLPGAGSGRAEQEARLRALAARLAELDGEAARWEAARETLEARVEGWIANGVRRV